MNRMPTNDGTTGMPIRQFRALIADQTRRGYVAPRTEFVTPCIEIAVETGDNPEWDHWTLAKRYAALTKPLPLAGAAVMHRTAAGLIALVAQLRADAPWFGGVIDAIEQQCELQLLLGRPWLSVRPMLIIGDPGVGKSHFARRLAELAGTGCGVADLSGTSDNRLIEGTPRGYTTAQPCFPALVMNQSRTANPVAIAEECNKAGGSARNGDPISSLLNLIEAGSAHGYFDKALLAPVDVSHVNWVATGNSLGRLPAAFLSRVDVFEVDPPAAAMFDGIVTSLTTALLRRWQLDGTAAFVIPKAAIATLRADFAKHRSVRRLGKMLERIAVGCLRMPAWH